MAIHVKLMRLWTHVPPFCSHFISQQACVESRYLIPVVLIPNGEPQFSCYVVMGERVSSRGRRHRARRSRQHRDCKLGWLEQWGLKHRASNLREKDETKLTSDSPPTALAILLELLLVRWERRASCGHGAPSQASLPLQRKLCLSIVN